MVPIIYLLLISSGVFGKEIVINDGTCFDTYTSELKKVASDLARETRTEYNLQLTSIEEMLNINHPEKGYDMPLGVPICPLLGPPSNYTIMTYSIINNLHMEKIRQSLINKHVLYRLLMIQRKISEMPSSTTKKSVINRIAGYI